MKKEKQKNQTNYNTLLLKTFIYIYTFHHCITFLPNIPVLYIYFFNPAAAADDDDYSYDACRYCCCFPLYVLSPFCSFYGIFPSSITLFSGLLSGTVSCLYTLFFLFLLCFLLILMLLTLLLFLFLFLFHVLLFLFLLLLLLLLLVAQWFTAFGMFP